MLRSGRVGPAAVSLAMGIVACAAPVAAQEGAGSSGERPVVSRNAPPSPNATINLINLLVKQGVITEEQAQTLIKQADDEAYVARQAVRDAAAKAQDAEKTATAASEAVSPPGTKRVTYVPEIVKKQIREDIKREVMEKAQKEGWAAPGKLPEWATRIRFFGDVRTRYEASFFPRGNNAPEFAVDYNAINTGSPYDVSEGNPIFWPTYNVAENRDRARLRARLGMEADLFENFWAGVRIATGDGNAPISFNATLGGSGGNFSKYSVWLDRGFIKYGTPNLSVTAGRFDNPFFSPSDLVYHRDLGFDGLAVQTRFDVWPNFTPFAVAGAFPVFNTALNIPTNELIKKPSDDKWMFGAQLGGNVRLSPEAELTVAAAYYDFQNVQGEVSAPCFANDPQFTCSTDLRRPSFAQKGNTYMALRDITPINPGDPNEPRFQYFGLASSFRPLQVNGRLDLGHFHPVHIFLDGEYVINTAFNKDDAATKAFFNPVPAGPIRPVDPANPVFIYEGGNQGWLGRITVGHREFKELWDWSFHAGYRYLESDAVIDAFTDSDFGYGGTNLKGYFVGGSVALGPNVWMSARWMSANQVAGAPYAVDILQIDLNGKF